MKTFRTTLIYLVVFACLGGYIYFFERGPVKKKDEDKKIKVFENFVADDISEIQLENIGTTLTAEKSPIDIQKDDKGVWRIISPKKIKADETTVRSLLSAVGDFNPDATIDNPTNLSDYGLNSPNARCAFRTKAGTSYGLILGDKSVAGTSYYAKTSDKKVVYLLPSFPVENLKKPLNNYRDHTFLKTDSVLAKKVRITRDGKVFTFEKDKDNFWDITEPIRDKADETKVRDILNGVSGLRADDFVSENPSGSTYGLAKPHLKVEVWPNDGGTPKSILLGRKRTQGGFYAKSGDSSSVCLVGEYFDKNMDIKLSDCRDKTTMKFDAGLAKTLTVQRTGRTYVYQKGEKGLWTSEGRFKAQEEAANLISQLSQTTIAEFASKEAVTGLKNPSFIAEVALGDGTSRRYRFGLREKEQVYLASDKTKEVYLVQASVVSQMEAYFNSILTPVAVSSPLPAVNSK